MNDNSIGYESMMFNQIIDCLFISIDYYDRPRITVGQYTARPILNNNIPIQ